MGIVSIIAIIVGPIAAVCITLWWQQRKEKRDERMRLFVTLMAHRKSFPPTHDWVNALNLIDVVFADYRSVVARWHEYYALLHQNTDFQGREHKYIEMLSEMAAVLGLRGLQQTDIDKFYSPVVHGEQLKIESETQKEWLRVLKSTSHLLGMKLDDKDRPAEHGGG
jgi:hypothetical protein